MMLALCVFGLVAVCQAHSLPQRANHNDDASTELSDRKEGYNDQTVDIADKNFAFNEREVYHTDESYTDSNHLEPHKSLIENIHKALSNRQLPGNRDIVPDREPGEESMQSMQQQAGKGMVKDHEGDHMQMYFFFKSASTFLYQQWRATGWIEFLLSCIAFALAAILLEGLKVLRMWLDARSRSVDPELTPCLQTEGEEVCRDNKWTKCNKDTGMSSPWNRIHFIQTFLHLLQLFLSYCLMLLVMTFNAYLLIVVCLGGAIGYFCFSWKTFAVVQHNNHVHTH